MESNSYTVAVGVTNEARQVSAELCDENSLIVGSINDGIAVFDPDGRILSMNPALLKRMNISYFTPGMHLSEVFPPEKYGSFARSRLDNIREVCSTAELLSFEVQRNGRYYDNKLYPLLINGTIKSVTLLSADITDRKTAAEAELRNVQLQLEGEILRRREAEYLEILDGSNEAAWIKDLKSNHFEYSEDLPGRIGLEGIPPEGLRQYLNNRMYPEDRERVTAEKNQLYSCRQPKYMAQFRLQIPDGSYLWILNKGKITYDENGKPSKIYGTSTDITAHKRAEATILRQNAILKTINAVHESALNCTTSKGLSAACLQIVDSLLGCSCFLAESRSDGKLIIEAVSLPAKRLTELPDHPPGGVLRHMFRKPPEEGMSFYSNSPSEYFRDCEHPEFSAFLCVPFARDNKIAGLIGAVKTKGVFTDEDKDILEAVTPTVVNLLAGKRAEEAVRENELLLRTILDSSSDFLFIKDKESRVVTVNKAYLDTFGVRLEDVIGKSDYELYPADPVLVDTVIEHDHFVMRTGQPMLCEESSMTANGFRTYQISKVPWRDTGGAIIGILGISRDITQLKHAEATLRETVASLERSKEYINILYETTGKILSSPQPIKDIEALCVKVMNFLNCQVFTNYLTTGDRTSLRLNAGTGIPEEIKREIALLPAEASLCGRALRDLSPVILENVMSVHNPELTLLQSMGIRAYACNPLISKGRPIGTLSFGTKIRNRFTEEELQLMKTVSESVSVAISRKQNEDKLIAQTKELKAAGKSKDDFLITLSHELRNPLATIVAGFSLLDISENDAQRNKATTILKRQVQQLRLLTEDILEVSRITQNKIILKLEICDLCEIAASAAEDHAWLFEEKGVAFSVQIGNDPLSVIADPVRVRQIIGNLLHNALKFTGSAGKVVLRVCRDTDKAIISVRDTGEGIDPDFMPSLFEPFMQANKAPDRLRGGLGLGLYIVRGIAELHGGTITASSEGLGKGSEFTITLPLRPIINSVCTG